MRQNNTQSDKSMNINLSKWSGLGRKDDSNDPASACQMNTLPADDGTNRCENANGCESTDRPYSYKYPRPSLTTDCVVFGSAPDGLKILLVERGVEPFKGNWALPGGFMKMDETLEECAARELFEETNMECVYLTQFRAFSSLNRDPRGRVVTVAFIALVRPSEHNVVGGDDASNALWFDIDMLPPMAFDHISIIEEAKDYLRELLLVKPIAFQLLNKVFTIDELRRVYEQINDTVYDRRNFTRKLMQANIVSEVPADMDFQETGSRNSRKLYMLNEELNPSQDVTTEEKAKGRLVSNACYSINCPTEKPLTESVENDECMCLEVSDLRDCCVCMNSESQDSDGGSSEESEDTSEKRNRKEGSIKNLFNFI